jgi:Tfp pilus assembly protein PilF
VQRNFDSHHSSGKHGNSSGNRGNFSHVNRANFHHSGGSGKASHANFVSRNFKTSHSGNWHGQHSGGNHGNFNHNGSHSHNGNGNWKGNNWNGHNHGWAGNKGWHGYGNQHFHHHHGSTFPWWGFLPGWGGWGWGGWGWGGWGWGWGGSPYYYGLGGLGYGFGYGLGYCGWGGYGGGYYGGYPYYGYGYSGYPSGTYVYADDAAPALEQAPLTDATVQPPASAAPTEASEFVSLGEDAFQAGRYDEAVRNWQHAMVDDPNNGAVVLLMAQALFAKGQYEAAANTVQMAMQVLPEAEWGKVVQNYSQLYPSIQDYTNQIRAAEKARDAKPEDNAIRFLLGYHFGYLNYPKQAVRELDKALDIEPKDAGAAKLREIFAKQGGLPARPQASVPEATPQAPPKAEVPPEKAPAEPAPKATPQPPAAQPPPNPDEPGTPAG